MLLEITGPASIRPHRHDLQPLHRHPHRCHRHCRKIRKHPGSGFAPQPSHGEGTGTHDPRAHPQDNPRGQSSPRHSLTMTSFPRELTHDKDNTRQHNRDDDLDSNRPDTKHQRHTRTQVGRCIHSEHSNSDADNHRRSTTRQQSGDNASARPHSPEDADTCGIGHTIKHPVFVGTRIIALIPLEPEAGRPPDMSHRNHCGGYPRNLADDDSRTSRHPPGQLVCPWGEDAGDCQATSCGQAVSTDNGVILHRRCTPPACG